MRAIVSPNFHPFPVLHTARLTLRRPVSTDVHDLFALRSDPEVMRYIPRPLAQSLKDVHELLWKLDEFVDRGERINWAIEWKETGTVVGMIGYVNLKPEHSRGEVGYSLTKAWWRQGIALEALKAVISWGYDHLGLHSIEAIVDSENPPSICLLEKAGFRREALFREDFFWDGRYRDSVHLGLLQREWEAANL